MIRNRRSTSELAFYQSLISDSWCPNDSPEFGDIEDPKQFLDSHSGVGYFSP